MSARFKHVAKNLINDHPVESPPQVSRSLTSRTWLTIVLALVLAAAAVGAYWTAFDNEFIWDDPIIFQRQLPYFDSMENVFFPPKKIPQFGFHYYRPLIVVTYQIDEYLAKTFWEQDQREQARQVVYHSSVVFYHAIATLLVFLLGLRLTRITSIKAPLDLAAAAGGAFLFALHPIHVESVAWMAGRSDVICAIFIFASLLTYLRYKELARWPDLVCALVFAFAAMLSKETGVAILLMVPVLDLLVRHGISAKENPGTVSPQKAGQKKARPDEKRRKGNRTGLRVKVEGASASRFIMPLWVRWIGFGLVWFAYSSLRGMAVNPGNLRESGVDLPGFFSALGWYLQKALWPGEQSAFVSDIPGTVYALLGFLALAVAGYVLYRGWIHNQGRAEALALTIFFASLAPSLAIVVFRISETPLAERYLYLPSAGFCLLAGVLLGRMAARLPSATSNAVRVMLVVVPVIMLALPAAYATYQRGEVWQNDLAFWTDTVAKADDQGLPHLHLGLTYNQLGEEEKALEQYQEALVKYDDAEGRSKAYNNMGTLHLSRGEMKQAAEALRGALKERPRYPTANYNLALVEVNLSRRRGLDNSARNQHLQAAEKYLNQAIRLNPRYTKAHLQYGRLLLSTGRRDQGIKHLQTVIKLAPASRQADSARQVLGSR